MRLKVSNKSRILILEDHPLVRKGIIGLLEVQTDFLVSGEAEDGETALSLVESLRPDIVILDITLKNSNGLDVLKKIKARFPNVKVLVLSGCEESVYAPRVLRAGASGYLVKTECHKKLIYALRKIAIGDVYFSEKFQNLILKCVSENRVLEIERLSDRELEIFTLIGTGYHSRGIAEKLNLSIKTVDAHRFRIKTKLEIATAVELVCRAVQWAQHMGVVPERKDWLIYERNFLGLQNHVGCPFLDQQRKRIPYEEQPVKIRVSDFGEEFGGREAGFGLDHLHRRYRRQVTGNKRMIYRNHPWI